MKRTFFKAFSFFAIIALAGFFTSCQQEDNITGIADVENFVLKSTMGVEDQCGAGRAGCYELVFPITLQFADNSTVEVNSYDEMKQAMRDWFEANGGPGNGGGPGGGHHGHGGPHMLAHPIIVLPFQVISESGEIILIETLEQLAEIRALCDPGEGGPGGPHGGAPCFVPSFPLTVMFADGQVVTVNTREELREATQAWHLANPGLRPHPEFVFPITVTLQDGSQVVVNSREELQALKQACRG